MKIVILSSHTPSIFWFRMDMMENFVKLGHSVIAVGQESESKWKDKFEKHGIQYKQIFVKRNSINPICDFKTFRDINNFIKKEKPDKIFTYQAKTVIYGCLAAKVNGIKEVYTMVAGLGSIFRGCGIKNNLIKTVLTIQYRVAFKISKIVFFQNYDDKNEFVSRGLVDERKVVVINGSGINLDKFTQKPLPDSLAFLFIGRLIKDKGIMEYLEACKRIKVIYPEIKCMLVGPFDTNLSAIQTYELKPYLDNGIVDFYGEQEDVRPFIEQCSVYVLPSYHEGTPKTVLEAMAVGRPIITSDAPGCRETVIHGHNGFLVAVKDIDGLVEKMQILINDETLREKMSERSLKIAREKYDINLVNKSIMQSMELI